MKRHLDDNSFKEIVCYEHCQVAYKLKIVGEDGDCNPSPSGETYAQSLITIAFLYFAYYTF